MPTNTIRDLFVARIKQLLSQFEGSKSIEHGPTVGAMREDYLKSMLREMLPPKFAPESGFIGVRLLSIDARHKSQTRPSGRHFDDWDVSVCVS